MDTRFHCVYLLTSLDPQCCGDFYIGYTVNPLRRLRQHNGELVNGARRTSRRGRPWTLVCCVSGFAEDRAALKFEWSWQHPAVSARLKHTVPHTLSGLGRLPFAVGTLHYLLQSDLFNRLELRLHIFEKSLFDEAAAVATSYVARGLAAKRRHRRPDTEATHTPPPTDDASGLTSSQGLSDPPALPPLTPSPLFSIQLTTREAFEDTYLAHDRCLARQLAEAGSLHELSVLSCPYDVSVLSQVAEQARTTSDDDEEAAGSESPVPLTLGWSESEDDAVGEAMNGGSQSLQTPLPTSPLATPLPSPPPLALSSATRGASTPVKTRPCPEGEMRRSCSEGNSHSAAPVSTRRGASLPLPAPSGASLWGKAGVSGAAHTQANCSATFAADVRTDTARRVPRRFRGYKESDFLRDHTEELAQLEASMLPCTLCALPLRAPYIVRCGQAPFCALRCHLTCLALWAHVESSPGLQDTLSLATTTSPSQPLSLVPSHPFACPLCHELLHWASLVKELKLRAVRHDALQTQRRRLQTQAVWEARLATMTVTHQRHTSSRRAQRHERAADHGDALSLAPPSVKGTRTEVPSPHPPPHVPVYTRCEADTQVDEVSANLSLTTFDPSEW